MFANLVEQGKELAKTFGERIVPVIEDLSAKFETIIPMIAEFVEKLIGVGQEILANVGPALEQLGDTFMNVIMPALQPTIDLVMAMGDMFTRLFDPIMNVANAFIENLKPILDVYFNEVLPVGIALFNDFVKMFEEELLPVIEEVVVAFTEAVVPALEKLSEWVIFLLKKVFIPFYEFLRQYIIPLFMNVAKTVLGVVRDAFRIITKLLKGDFAGAFEAVGTLLTNLKDGVAGIFGSMLDAAKGAVAGIVDAVRGMARDVASAVKDVPVIGGVIGKLAGFQHGGQFVVGGAGGPDSQTVAFRATPGETVTVSPPGRGGGGGFAPTIVVQGSLITERELSDVIVSTMREATRLNGDVLDVTTVSI
jgi:phage-related protein